MGRRRAGIAAVSLLSLLSFGVAVPGVATPEVVGDDVDSVQSSDEAAEAPVESVHSSSVEVDDRGEVLPEAWESSDDVAWTTIGDANGFHVLVADAASGYEWRTLATIAEPLSGDSDWLGNACLTSSGETLAVVYAPASFANDPELFDRGGLVATVDMESGEVAKHAVSASLAYFNPGCGAADRVAIVAARAEDHLGESRVVVLDAATGELSEGVEVQGQVTSAVPIDEHTVVAARGPVIERIEADASTEVVADTDSVPFRLTLDDEGDLYFLDVTGVDESADAASTSGREELPAEIGGKLVPDESQPVHVASLKHLSSEQLRGEGARNRGQERRGERGQRHGSGSNDGTVLGQGRLGEFTVHSAADGKVRVAGNVELTADGDQRLIVNDKVDVMSTPSTRGEVYVNRPQIAGDETLLVTEGPAVAEIDMYIPAKDATAELFVDLDAAPVGPSDDASELSPLIDVDADVVDDEKLSTAEGDASVMSGGVDLSDPFSDRACAISRGDPNMQAMQPRPRQVEWAASQISYGTIDDTFNRAGVGGWRERLGLDYTPSQEFPIPQLSGGGGDIPAQIILGIALTESNMRQASRYSLPGVTGNPLIGNYWGTGLLDPWAPNFESADCGYGVMQVTDGMHKLHGTYTPPQQKAIATDYVANMMAGTAILADKWNQTYDAGLVINDGNPVMLENWFYALWAYNSGFYPESMADSNGGSWGVGWHNNPANPKYLPYRHPFLHNNRFEDGRTPNMWPYPERVLGWAAWPPELMDGPDESVPAYRPARWVHEDFRESVKPSHDLFCDESNNCRKDLAGDQDVHDTEICYSTNNGDYDYRCWYNQPVTWKENCSGNSTHVQTCGVGFRRFPRTHAEEVNGYSHPPNCSRTATSTSNSLPANAIVVDNVPADAPRVRSTVCDDFASTDSGTFSWEFNAVEGGWGGVSQPKIDIHQLGAGWGSHFFVGHTRSGELGERLRATGTWKLGQDHAGWMRIGVHLPNHHAHTQQAKYVIDLGDGRSETRYINQRRMENNWVSLGAYYVNGRPSVSLSNVTLDGNGSQSIAWDAVFFQPLPDEPLKIAVLGDSFSSGEGTGFASESGPAGYYPETNVGRRIDSESPDSVWKNSCRRSPKAWARQIELEGLGSIGDLQDSWDSAVELQFVACSGARTLDLSTTPWDQSVPWYTPELSETAAEDGRETPQYGEVRQGQSGVLTDDTDYVLLTIGGNDGGLFGDIVTKCILPGCHVLEPLNSEGAEFVTAGLIERTESVLGEISESAPNAAIVVGAYPVLFKRSGVSPLPCSVIEGSERDSIGLLQQLYDNELVLLADDLKFSGLNVSAIRVDGFFSPDGSRHDVCAGDSRWLNGLVGSVQGDGDNMTKYESDGIIPAVSMASIHPNEQGSAAYARAFECALRSDQGAMCDQSS